MWGFNNLTLLHTPWHLSHVRGQAVGRRGQMVNFTACLVGLHILVCLPSLPTAVPDFSLCFCPVSWLHSVERVYCILPEIGAAVSFSPQYWGLNLGSTELHLWHWFFLPSFFSFSRLASNFWSSCLSLPTSWVNLIILTALLKWRIDTKNFIYYNFMNFDICIQSWDHPHNQDSDISITPNYPCILL